MHFGRCYTVSPKLALPIADILSLKLNASMNYRLLVHEANEEIWLSGNNYFPTTILKISLGEKRKKIILFSMPLFLTNRIRKKIISQQLCYVCASQGSELTF
jgi:hypothetical protein